MVRRLVPLLAVAPLLGAAAPAYACVCIPRPPVTESIATAEVAFAGEVVSGGADGHFVVEVSRVFKGSVPARTTVFAESSRSSSCGVDVPLGPILYAGDADRRFGSCSPTLVGDQAARALAEPLPAGEPPMPAEAVDPAAPRRGPPANLLVLFAATVAAAAAYAFSRRRGGGRPDHA